MPPLGDTNSIFSSCRNVYGFKMMITANEPPSSKPRLIELPVSTTAALTINTSQALYSPLSPGNNSSSMSPNPYPTSNNGPPSGGGGPWSSGGPGDVPVDLTAALKATKDIFPARKQREFIPDSKKDDSYWDRRRRNNEAAKRSREKRRLNDMVLETRMLELTKENALLRAEIVALREKFSLPQQPLVSPEQLHLHLNCPPVEVRNRRSKLLSTLLPNGQEAGGPMMPGGPVHPQNPEHQLHHMMPPLHMIDPAQWQECHENALKESQHHHHQQMLLNHHHQHHQHHQQQQQQLHQQVIQRLTAASRQEEDRDYGDHPADHRRSPSPRASPPVDESCSWSSSDEPMQVQINPQHCLPLKLRHKTLMTDKDEYVPTYPDSGRSSGRDDTSSDGDSSTGGGKESPVHKMEQDESPPRKMPRLSRRGNKSGSSDLQAENFQLRYELKKLASEVAGLKDMLMCNRPPSIDIPSNVETTTPPHSNRTSPNIVEPQKSPISVDRD